VNHTNVHLSRDVSSTVEAMLNSADRSWTMSHDLAIQRYRFSNARSSAWRDVIEDVLRNAVELV
jgi:hypothetical protein